MLKKALLLPTAMLKNAGRFFVLTSKAMVSGLRMLKKVVTVATVLFIKTLIRIVVAIFKMAISAAKTLKRTCCMLPKIPLAAVVLIAILTGIAWMRPRISTEKMPGNYACKPEILPGYNLMELQRIEGRDSFRVSLASEKQLAPMIFEARKRSDGEYSFELKSKEILIIRQKGSLQLQAFSSEPLRCKRK